MFEHSDCYNIPPPAGPAGENLAMGYGGGTQATDGWYREVANWAFSPGDGTGNSGTTGHFSAMIWKGVKKLGCGLYASSKIWVCRYKAGDTLSGDTPNMGGTADLLSPLNERVVMLTWGAVRSLQGQRAAAERQNEGGVRCHGCSQYVFSFRFLICVSSLLDEWFASGSQYRQLNQSFSHLLFAPSFLLSRFAYLFCFRFPGR